MKTVVGIDLGTTFSLVAHLEGGTPRVLPNALGELLTPSAVSIAEDGTLLVGAAARSRLTTHPERTARSFKRDMGTERRFTIAGRELTPVDLSAMVLASLKEDAERALGRTVDEAVVTVPAYFGDAQRQATRDAATIAGLHVERIINEPTAAALAYGLHERHRERRAVVLDLGGGTFDVTVLEIIEGVVEIQSSAGDARLGGDDFDDAIAALLAKRIRDEFGANPTFDARTSARLREAAEGAKKRLSDAESTRVAITELPKGRDEKVDVELTLTRAEAETAWALLLDRIRIPIVRALRDARTAPAAIEEVLLVGGSTRMPCISRLAAQIFGRLPLRKLPPDEAIALGAAVQAALKAGDAAVEDMVVTDVAPFTLGIRSSSELGDALVDDIFTPIIDRGTVIPVSRLKRFFTMRDMQKEIRVEVYQGEHTTCRENQKLGAYLVAVPPKARGAEKIDVRFTYDLNGILDVDTTVVSTGVTKSLSIERAPGRMTKSEVAAARKAMERLKFHPRDALPNTAALMHAEALFVELTGPMRSALGHEIAHFRVLLETQDAAQIETARGNLSIMVSQLGRAR